MNWIESAGGPIVAIPSQHVRLWSDRSDHYDLACGVEDVGIIRAPGERDPFAVLVLWGEPYSTTVMPELALIVQWQYADSEESLLALVSSSFESVDWSSVGEMAIANGMAVFDAAVPGVELDADDGLELPVAPGDYVAEVGELADERTSARLVRLRPVRHSA